MKTFDDDARYHHNLTKNNFKNYIKKLEQRRRVIRFAVCLF